MNKKLVCLAAAMLVPVLLAVPLFGEDCTGAAHTHLKNELHEFLHVLVTARGITESNSPALDDLMNEILTESTIVFGTQLDKFDNFFGTYNPLMDFQVDGKSAAEWHQCAKQELFDSINAAKATSWQEPELRSFIKHIVSLLLAIYFDALARGLITANENMLSNKNVAALERYAHTDFYDLVSLLLGISVSELEWAIVTKPKSLGNEQAQAYFEKCLVFFTQTHAALATVDACIKQSPDKIGDEQFRTEILRRLGGILLPCAPFIGEGLSLAGRLIREEYQQTHKAR